MATPEAPFREVLKSLWFTKLPLYLHEPFFSPAAITEPQLFVYGPNTLDVECLRILALLKFVQFKFDVHYTREPNMSPNKKLPFMLLPDGTALDSTGIVDHLDKSGHQLPKSDLQDELVYTTMVRRNLAPAIDYMIWVDQTGVEKVVQPEYLAGYQWIVQSMLGWVWSADHAQRIQSNAPELGVALDGEVIYENALRALDSLLVLLGDRRFLAGVPSQLDAYVFACLHAVMQAPLKSPLRTALTQDKRLKPLLDYTLRMCSQLFDSNKHQ